MCEAYWARVSTTIYLKVQIHKGDPLPDLCELVSSQLSQHPLVVEQSIWEQLEWERCAAPWERLEESPFEAGDVVIHACQVAGIGRTLLAEVVQDEGMPSRLNLIYRSNAEEEDVERAVWKYMRAAYPMGCRGIYPCPQELLASLQ
jgi:hypothetical protein